MASARLFGNIILMTGLKLVGLLLSVALIVLQAAIFGTTQTADAYFFVRRLILSAIVMVFSATNQLTVPEFVRALHGAEGDGPRRAMLRFGVPVVLLVSVVALVSAAYSTFIVGSLAPGFGPERVEEAAKLLRIVLICLPLSAIAAMAGAFNFARRKFGITTLARLAPRIALLLAIAVLGAQASPVALSRALVAGVAIMTLLIVWRGWRSLRGSRTEPAKGGAATKTRTRAVAVTLNAAAQMATGWMDSALASLTGIGGVTIMFVAQRLLSAAPGAVNSAVNSAYYTEYSHNATTRETHPSGQIASAVRISLFLTLPLVVFVMTTAEPLIRFLLEHGAFTAQDSAATADLVRFLAPLLLVNAVLAALIPAVLADDRLPLVRVFLWFAAASLLIRLAAGLPLAQIWGLKGLAISILLASTGAAGVLGFYLHRHHGSLFALSDLRALGSMIASALVTGLAALQMAAVLEPTGLWSLIAMAGAVAVLFLLSCAACRLSEIDALKGLLAGKARA